MIRRTFLVLFLLLLLGAPLSMAQAMGGDGLQPAVTEVETTINNELHRIRRELTLLRMEQEKPKMTEVIGGIGYILGIFGVAAYFLARRDRERSVLP